MNELIQLKSSLAQTFHDVLPTSLSWENSKAIKNLQEINQQLDGVSSAPPSTSIAQVIAIYRQSNIVANFRNKKYVCYGLAMRMQDGWSLLGDDSLRSKLLADIDQIENCKQGFRCFQALLSSYFAFARFDEQTSNEAQAGWEILRDWLARKKVQFQRDGENKKLRLPSWFAILTKHENLLTNKPCDKYGADMLRGDNSNLEDARQGLGIPSGSWIVEETILSQIRAAGYLGDEPFKTHIDQLLKPVLGQTEVKVSELLMRRAIALLVSRYTRCVSKPEHPALRDAAVAIIGNPWLKRTAWDAWVKRAGNHPDDEAREMINGWLKRRLITDFFAVLSEDGQVDQRRLKYWLRFETVIEDIWLVLGPEAMWNNSEPYKELRKRSVGRLQRLENAGQSNNNAFIMRIGDWLIVEFGVTGNACYIYPLNPVPFDLQGKSISLYNLKNKDLGKPHNHVANGWESNFDHAICQKVGYYPQGAITPRLVKQDFNSYHIPIFGSSSTATSSASLQHAVNNNSHNLSYVEQYVNKFGLQTEDKRGSGGAFWVYTTRGDYPEVDRNLESWKFDYRPQRGWYRE